MSKKPPESSFAASTVDPARENTLRALSLGALGVVFGDIGTSPLYAFNEAFKADALSRYPAHIFGVLSLIFWSLVFVVSFKYAYLILNADNKGEGGTLSLMRLAQKGSSPRTRRFLLGAGLLGAALFYGDCALTPAISVLSAMEGLSVVAPRFQEYSFFLALCILFFLFFFQKKGTKTVGALFGPVMIVWFFVLAALGLAQIIERPEVLQALDPRHAFNLALSEPKSLFIAILAVTLCLTGCEALYTDMGHFGKKSVRVAWFGCAFPALVLNYFGQGAWLLAHPTDYGNPFYAMAPQWSQWPLLILAAGATVIASQAVISGAFSVTRQAIALGYFPRLEIRHTSEHEIGQIYMPSINLIIALAVFTLALVFKTSSALAAAYGIAVICAMSCDSVSLFFAARNTWRWTLARAIAVFLPILFIDALFLGANLTKFTHGGYITCALAAGALFLMLTWKRGSLLLNHARSVESAPLKKFVSSLSFSRPHCAEGCAIFLTTLPDIVPVSMLHNIKHNQTIHAQNVILNFQWAEVPYVSPELKTKVEKLDEHFWRVGATLGYKEQPDAPEIMRMASALDPELRLERSTYFLSRDSIAPLPGSSFWVGQEKVFAWMSKNAAKASDWFRIPAGQVIEIGSQVRI